VLRDLADFGIARDCHLVIFSPHPDDSAISAGALLQECVAAGVRVSCVLMTDGSEAVIPHGFLSNFGWQPNWSAADTKLLRGRIRVNEATEELWRLGVPDSPRLLTSQKWFLEHRTPLPSMHEDLSLREVNAFKPGPIDESAIREVADILEATCSPRVVCLVPHPSDRLLMHRITSGLVVHALRKLASGVHNRFSFVAYDCLSTQSGVDDCVLFAFGISEMKRKCWAIHAHESMKARRSYYGGYANGGRAFYDELVMNRNAQLAMRCDVGKPYAERYWLFRDEFSFGSPDEADMPLQK
jgi:hypothetical protein